MAVSFHFLLPSAHAKRTENHTNRGYTDHAQMLPYFSDLGSFELVNPEQSTRAAMVQTWFLSISPGEFRSGNDLEIGHDSLLPRPFLLTSRFIFPCQSMLLNLYSLMGFK